MARIWVDADAAPRAVKELLTRAAGKRGVDVILVADRPIWVSSPRVSSVQVPRGPDSADDHIAEACEAGDLVITADIPLAARAVEKGAMVIRPRGYVLDEENVQEALSMRDFSTELRDVGVSTSGPPPFGPNDRQRFANALDRWVTKNI